MKTKLFLALGVMITTTNCLGQQPIKSTGIYKVAKRFSDDIKKVDSILSTSCRPDFHKSSNIPMYIFECYKPGICFSRMILEMEPQDEKNER